MKLDLAKQSARVQLVLTKRQLPNMRASVGLTLDVSGSTQGLYASGTIQRLLEQIVPVALKADDNQNLDVYTFSSGEMINQVDGATAENYENFVQEQILDNDDVDKWSGTSYAPVIQQMIEDYGFVRKAGGFLGFGGTTQLVSESASGEAVLNYFITDGENDDKDATEKLFAQLETAKSNMYFMLIGVGHQSFSFLRQLADRHGNVGFLNVSDLQKFVNEDNLYEQLLPVELTQWLKQKTV